jgi:peroxiredoxin
MRLFSLLPVLAFSCVVAQAQEGTEKAAPSNETPPAPAKTDSAPAAAAKPCEPPLPGHSMHGEAFNEGPRQFAILMPGVQSVDFPVTTKSAEAQKFFNQGVTQLHGFWYFEAERSFRQVAYLDPDCAMAYWGMGMANINNEKRAKDFMKESSKRRDKASPREQRWIDAWAAYYTAEKKDDKARRSGLIKALEDLIYQFPEDVEAKAYLVFQLWDNQQHNIPLPSRFAVDAIAQQVLAKAPMHPGVHHYLIHLWNHKDGDKRAVASAARCGQSAPGIAHLWHMSGHTFSELRRYPEATWQQEASARVDHGYMHAAKILPEQIHNYAHNNDWLVKNLTYVGRVHDAVDLAKNLVELPRLGPGKQQAWRMGRDRLIETAATFELWNELTKAEDTPYLSKEDDVMREIGRLRVLGVAAFGKGDRPRGQERLETLKEMFAKARVDRVTAADKAEAEAKKAGKSEDQIARAMADAMRNFAGQLTALEYAMADVRLARALANGDGGDARKQLELAKDIPSIRQARIRAELGEFEKAESLARDVIKADPGQVLPHAVLAHVLWQAGKREPARVAFEALRERAAQIDLDVPPFARLAPIVAELNLPTDWRPHLSIPPDAGERPELARLGPFRWQPYRAPEWSLPDQHHQAFSLPNYKGKPVLVVFYLGAGCSHCIEQLNVLSPLAGEFAKAGVEIVAISTDTPHGLDQTFKKAKEEKGFNFPILSDHELDTFKAYRAFDDFEGQPLHGTFLVDAAGHVRWQNIGYRPFTEIKWLLGESKRLLGLPAGHPASVAAADR